MAKDASNVNGKHHHRQPAHSPTLRLAMSVFAAVAMLLPAAAAAADGDGDGDQGSTTGAAVVLDISVISLTERDNATEVTVTAEVRDAVKRATTIALDLRSAPPRTPGVAQSATRGADYSTDLDTETVAITIAAGSERGQISFTIDPTYDTDTEGDEAIVIVGTSAIGTVAPTELIIEDGPYLAFPKLIYGHLAYPGQPISVTVPEVINTTASDSTVSYFVSAIEPSTSPIELTFNRTTGRLTGTAPPASEVPETGMAARWTITAREDSGRWASVPVSVAVVRDVCSATQESWFSASDEPPPGLTDDCNVLLASRDSLNGTSGSLNWSTDVVIDDWDGLDEFHTDWKQIRRIEIQGRRLNGTIPAVLGHLGTPSSLTLALGDDHRESPVERRNQLSGPIPPELGLPPNLVVLALSGNPLTGPIPRELTSSGKLSALFLHETGVEGPIPSEFGDLPMVTLAISGSRGVSGYIPWQLGKNVSSGDHPGLQVLNLYGNSLSGQIPWQLGRFGKIQHFAVSDNQLTDAIPPQLGGLGSEEAGLQRRAVDLYLNANLLSGAIPPELGDIANLRVLSLSQNRLSAAIPPELGRLAKLQHLFARDNRLSGLIPPELGSLSKLATLRLECNDLSGTAPARLGMISTLTELRLHGNRLLDTSLVETTTPHDEECAPTYTGLATRAIEVIVWRSVFAERYYLSARNEGGRWMTGDAGFDLAAPSESAAPVHGSPVSFEIELRNGKMLPIEIRLSRSASGPARYLLSTRSEGRGWTTHDAAIDLSAEGGTTGFRLSDPTTIEIDLR